jgi:hypothetical protein
MHLNDGVEDDQGDPTFFHVDIVTDNKPSAWKRTTTLPEQAIESSYVGGNAAARWRVEQSDVPRFGLVSRKETDAIYLEVMDFDPRLALDLVAKRGNRLQVSARRPRVSRSQVFLPQERCAIAPRYKLPPN